MLYKLGKFYFFQIYMMLMIFISDFYYKTVSLILILTRTYLLYQVKSMKPSYYPMISNK